MAKIKYTAESLVEIADDFDKQAAAATERNKKTHKKTEHALNDREAEAWTKAAEILRNTTLEAISGEG